MTLDILRVSYSSLGSFSSCPRKFEFNKIYPKRARLFDDTYAADVGKALHAGYQSFLIHRDKDKATWDFMLAFPYEQEYTQTNDYRSFDAALSTLELMFDSVKMEEYELAMIRRPWSMKEQLEAEAKGIVLGEAPVVPAIEVPFEIRFRDMLIPPCWRFPDGAMIAFTGFIDAITKHMLTDRYQTLDIKTSRVALKDATPKFKFDSQQVPYGVVVDHVAKGTVESFDVLYLDCYVDLVDPTVNLYPFTKTQDDVQEWATNKIIQFGQISKFLGADYFPRTDNGCLFYNRPCAYMEPCMSRDREMLTEWFLLGEEPREEEPFHPWIVADVGGES